MTTIHLLKFNGFQHVQTRPTNIHENQPSERFIRRAVSALQGVSSGSTRHVLPWQITSLEVEYERTEENCLGAGGFGKVFKGEWHGEVGICKSVENSALRVLEAGGSERDAQKFRRTKRAISKGRGCI